MRAPNAPACRAGPVAVQTRSAGGEDLEQFVAACRARLLLCSVLGGAPAAGIPGNTASWPQTLRLGTAQHQVHSHTTQPEYPLLALQDCGGVQQQPGGLAAGSPPATPSRGSQPVLCRSCLGCRPAVPGGGGACDLSCIRSAQGGGFLAALPHSPHGQASCGSRTPLWPHPPPGEAPNCSWSATFRWGPELVLLSLVDLDMCERVSRATAGGRKLPACAGRARQCAFVMPHGWSFTGRAGPCHGPYSLSPCSHGILVCCSLTFCLQLRAHAAVAHHPADSGSIITTPRCLSAPSVACWS